MHWYLSTSKVQRSTKSWSTKCFRLCSWSRNISILLIHHGFGCEVSQGLPRRAVGLGGEGEWIRKMAQDFWRLWCARGGEPLSCWHFVHTDKRSMPPLSNWQQCHIKVRSQSRVCVCKSMSRNHLPYTLHTQARTLSYCTCTQKLHHMMSDCFVQTCVCAHRRCRFAGLVPAKKTYCIEAYSFP